MRRMKKMIKWFLKSIFILLILATCAIGITRSINADKNKIKTPDGIQEGEYINIGGIEQYLQIRGENIQNPLILWLHGGPGFPLTYLSHYYQRALESDYTIVSWEQRGCGRTYYKNDSGRLSVELILNDTDEIVNYLLERFQQEKIIIIGQSWGTVIGTLYLHKYPEKVSAYIGVGQVTDFDAGKIYAAERAVDVAKEKGNMRDVETLEKALDIFKKSTQVDDINIQNLETMIVTSLKYLKSNGQMSGIKQMWVGISSPNMSFDDLKWFFTASNTEKILTAQKPLVNYMYYDFDVKKISNKFEMPIYFIQGSHDWITPTDLVLQYLDIVKAPNKKIIIIKDSGHTPFLDNPKEFCKAVKNLLV